MTIILYPSWFFLSRRLQLVFLFCIDSITPISQWNQLASLSMHTGYRPNPTSFVSTFVVVLLPNACTSATIINWIVIIVSYLQVDVIWNGNTFSWIFFYLHKKGHFGLLEAMFVFALEFSLFAFVLLCEILCMFVH